MSIMIIYMKVLGSHNTFSGLMQPITGICGKCWIRCGMFIGGVLAGGGSITIGDIQAFIQYVRQFNQTNNTISTDNEYVTKYSSSG